MDGRWKNTGMIVLLAFITWILTLIGKNNSVWVEKIYASKLYPLIGKSLGRLTGLVPISIGEVLVFSLIVIMIASLGFMFIKPQIVISNGGLILHWVIRILGGAYILFYFIWGFNYYREDYTLLAAMSRDLASIEDLENLTLEFIKEANHIRSGLREDEEGVFVVEEDFRRLGEIANEGFEGYFVGERDLSGNYGSPKPLKVSKWMSYTGITGIYFPYTVEPNINVDVPDASMLATICHEMGHQRGFAKEEEANFIAYKASTNNPDPRFQYSGYYLALQYLLNDLYKQDVDLYYKVTSEISDGVKRDMNHDHAYWKSREGKVEEVATTMNDNYLKANNQSSGVQSYNGVVSLLLAEYKTR